MTAIVARPRTPARSCPYCRSAVTPFDPGCSCGVVYHLDCRAALGRCVTLGCATTSSVPRPRAEARPDPRAMSPAHRLAVTSRADARPGTREQSNAWAFLVSLLIALFVVLQLDEGPKLLRKLAAVAVFAVAYALITGVRDWLFAEERS